MEKSLQQSEPSVTSLPSLTSFRRLAEAEIYYGDVSENVHSTEAEIHGDMSQNVHFKEAEIHGDLSHNVHTASDFSLFVS